MKSDLRVLLLVAEPWRSDDSGGNTLDNFFRGMQNVELAQVYNSDKLPINDVCKKYFQISNSKVVKGFMTRRKVGEELHIETVLSTNAEEDSPNQPNSLLSKIMRWIKNIRPEFLIAIKNFVWRYSNWKTIELEAFIMNFNPDVIYAPCYASPFQLALTRHVKNITGKKIVTWSADDSYSLRQFSLSPFFWLNRFWNRYCLRKTYPFYDEFFSISEDEIEEMSPIVGRQMKILRKGVHVPKMFIPRTIHQPIKFIYAGGLYLNRHKSLIAIADVLRKINEHNVRAELHIYTGTKLEGKNLSLLNDRRSSFIHGLVSPDLLKELYQESDVAIHCESFDLKYRLMTRLSFSTKVIDCFQSGCAILAIAWKDHTALKYLIKEDAAFCVTSLKEIESMIFNIVNNPTLISKYALKAYECECRNHRIEDVQKTLYDSLLRCSN